MNLKKKNWIITGIVFVISLLIVFAAFLPFLQLSDFTKGFILGLVVVIAGLPLFRYIMKNKKGLYEKRNGKKLN